jgi:hypothetical protein
MMMWRGFCEMRKMKPAATDAALMLMPDFVCLSPGGETGYETVQRDGRKGDERISDAKVIRFNSETATQRLKMEAHTHMDLPS